MAPITSKRRRGEEEARRPKKKIRSFKKQKDYYSSSDEDSEPVNTTNGQKPAFRARDAPTKVPSSTPKPAPVTGSNAMAPGARPKSILKHTNIVKPRKPDWSDEEEDEVVKNTVMNAAPADLGDDSDVTTEDVLMDEAEVQGLKVDEVDEKEGSAAEDGNDNEEEVSEDEDSEDEEGDDMLDDEFNPDSGTTSDPPKLTAAQAAKKKRNDPTAFATSISRILDTKLTTAKRADPVLSRSLSAAQANAALSNSKLEAKARAEIRHERRQALERGRVKDVLGVETEGVDTGKVLEQEKRLKKMAQRGVVRLFNAVRAAQVKGEEAMRQARTEGVVGMKKREDLVDEMSKQGFLDLISSGGKKGGAVAA